MTPQLTILIAERYETTLDALKEQLSATNYALLHAKSEEEAVAFLERLKSKIEVAIVDLEMPDLSGWNLINRLLQHDIRPVKIVAVTSIYTPYLLEEMKKLGVDAVVRKPIPHDEWLTNLRTAIMPTDSGRAVGVG